MQNKVILAVIYVALSLLSAKAFAECEGKLHYLSEYNGSKIYTADTGNANYFDIAYKVSVAWRTTKNYVGILFNAEHAGDLHKIDTCL